MIYMSRGQLRKQHGLEISRINALERAHVKLLKMQFERLLSEVKQGYSIHAGGVTRAFIAINQDPPAFTDPEESRRNQLDRFLAESNELFEAYASNRRKNLILVVDPQEISQL